MIETFGEILREPAFPNLHAVLVHLPVALLPAALLLDLVCLGARAPWIDRAATSVWILGAAGTGAAWLAGQRAEEAIGSLFGEAQAVLADHEAFALLTLWAAAATALLRLLVSWLSRHDRRIRVGIFRLAAVPLAIATLLLLTATAHHGGALVYRHGVAVESAPAPVPPDGVPP